MVNLDEYAIWLDRDIALQSTLTDKSSDVLAWGSMVLIETVSRSQSVTSHYSIDSFLDKWFGEEKHNSLQAILLSQIFEMDHPWITPYLINRLRSSCSMKEVAEIAKLFHVFNKLHTVDPYQTIPALIESLERATPIARNKIPEIIAELEASTEEVKSKFVHSSYEWNIRSGYLEWERWMSLMDIAGTLLYAFALGLIASFSISNVSEQVLNVNKHLLFLVGITNLCAFMVVAFLFVGSAYRASETEKRLEPRLEISREFLSKREELKTQIIDHYVSFLEKKHEKWRKILTTVIRLYLTVTLSSVAALLLGSLPIEIMRYLLGGITLLSFMLSALAYKKMKSIETELVQKQRLLHVYYGK